ncbi:hypothetical protein [Cupriavidus nantongensis]
MRLLRALLFWFGIAIAAIALLGAYTVLTIDAPLSIPLRTV